MMEYWKNEDAGNCKEKRTEMQYGAWWGKKWGHWKGDDVEIVACSSRTNRQQHRWTIHRMLYHYDDFSFSFPASAAAVADVVHILDVPIHCLDAVHAIQTKWRNARAKLPVCSNVKVLLLWSTCWQCSWLYPTIQAIQAVCFISFIFTDYYLWRSCRSHLCVPLPHNIASAKKAAATFSWNEHSKQTFIDDDICFCFYYKFSWAFNFTLFHGCCKRIETRVTTAVPISIRVVVYVYCFSNPSAIKYT